MGGSCRQIGIIQIVKRKAGVYYTKNEPFMVYFTPSKVRFLSYNINGDCRDRKEFFRYEAAMSMQKKEGCDMHSLPKEDDAQCRIKPTIQKRQTFRTAIRKSKKLEVWRKIRQRRPKMAGNTPTFVLVV